MPLAFSPSLPIEKELPRRRKAIGTGSASCINPLCNQILFSKITLRGFGHALRRSQAVCLPILATIQHPVENTVTFSQKRRDKMRVTFLFRDRDVEWYKVQAPQHRCVEAVQPRRMVACNDQLALRLDLEKVLVEVSCCDPVAACDLLDPGLRPGTPLLCYTHDGDARTRQARQVSCRSILARGHQHLGRRGLYVVAKDALYHRQENRLAVGPGP